MYRPYPGYKKKISKKTSGHRNPKNILLHQSLPRSLSINKAQSRLAHLLPSTSKPNILAHHRSVSPMSVDDQTPVPVTIPATANSSSHNDPIIPTKKPCPKCIRLGPDDQCVRKVEVHRRKNVQQELSGVALTFAKEEERLPPLLVSF